MKTFFFLAIPLLALCSCQHYSDEYIVIPVTAVNGKWTFEKDTVTVTWGYQVMHQYINNIGAGSTMQFNDHSINGSINYVANPDTSLGFVYYLQNSNTNLEIDYPAQMVYGVMRPEQIYNYTVVKATDHELVLNYTYSYFDPIGTQGEIYGNYYWTK